MNLKRLVIIRQILATFLQFMNLKRLVIIRQILATFLQLILHKLREHFLQFHIKTDALFVLIRPPVKIPSR